MPYCQNCGTEVSENFCANCGAQTGTVVSAAPIYVIHENAVVKPRYSTGMLLFAGYLGTGFLLAALGCLIYWVISLFDPGYSAGERLAYLTIGLVCLGISLLGYLPGITAIRKRSPKGTAAEAFRSFFVKSLLVIFAWGVTLAGCVYIIGIFFKVWRFGFWAACPNDDQYTAFVNGEKIPVVRYFDNLPCKSAKRGKYVYKDDNGEFHRPPIH